MQVQVFVSKSNRASRKAFPSSFSGIKDFSSPSEVENVFNSTWVLLWVFNADDCLKACPHWSQMNGFSPSIENYLSILIISNIARIFLPVWILKWELRSLDCVKALLQNLQTYGFSPVWILLCLDKMPFLENFIWQTSHSYGFSPECILLCLVRELEVVNPCWQTEQTNGLAPSNKNFYLRSIQRNNSCLWKNEISFRYRVFQNKGL